MAITREYSNSINRTRQTLREQAAERFWAGFDAYCRGLSIADLHDEYEIRGWWSANKSQALAETPEAI